MRSKKNLQTSDDVLVLRPGDEASLTKIFTSQDVEDFARISLDTNKVHLDEAYASGTIFRRRIVHGKLVEGLVSAVLGTRLPGSMSVFRSTSAQFHAPVYLDQKVTATVRVRGLSPNKDNWVVLDTWARVRGKLVLSGEAVISLPKSKLDFRRPE